MHTMMRPCHRKRLHLTEIDCSHTYMHTRRRYHTSSWIPSMKSHTSDIIVTYHQTIANIFDSRRLSQQPHWREKQTCFVRSATRLSMSNNARPCYEQALAGLSVSVAWWTGSTSQKHWNQSKLFIPAPRLLPAVEPSNRHNAYVAILTPILLRSL